jgi:hypothetical protein
MLSAAALTSCATATPVSPTSFTAQLEAELAKQKADDCELFKPAIIPEDAPQAWRQHAEAYGVKWRSYCNPS